MGIQRRYSLRTLFVVTTLVAIWLGSQARVVRERESVVHRQDWPELMEYSFPYTHPLAPSRDPSLLWKLLGARSLDWNTLRMPNNVFSSADCRRVRRLFPEIQVEHQQILSPDELRLRDEILATLVRK